MTLPTNAERVQQALAEAMLNDPFVDDIRLAGTTQQDERCAHYAGLALAAMATPTPAHPATDEVLELREALADIFDHFEDRKQAPGHDHNVPGIWDDDISNREKRGTACYWCAKWERARQLVAIRAITGEAL